MTKRKRHAAIIELDDDMLLSYLDFVGGSIVRVFKEDHIWKDRTTSLVIEHPDLPEVVDGSHLQKIVPSYYSNFGRIDRVDPPKQHRRRNKPK